MRPMPDDVPYDWPKEKKEALTRSLETPTDEPVPIIFDNDIFRAIFHNEGRDFEMPPKGKIPLPPKEWFDDVHCKYRSGSLRVLMPDDYRLLPYSSKECAIRLFMDIGDLRPSEKPRFDIEDIKINGQNTAWDVFQRIIQYHEEKKKDFESAHKCINWMDIASRFGRPDHLSVTRRISTYYYECIGPIVSLWLWEVELVRARQNVIQCCRPLGRLVPGQSPSHEMIDQFTWSIDALNKELNSPLSPEELRPLQEQPNVVKLVAEIAQKKEYRRIARFLPSHLAQTAIDIIQWVLDNNREPWSARKDVVKLLQDLVNESGLFLPDMEVENFVENMDSPKVGGEANIVFGQCQGRDVAVRKPHSIGTQHRGVAWMREKRYKRSIVHHRQISHNNVIKILGFLNYGGKIGIVMERMAKTLDQHMIPSPSVISNGTFEKLAKGIVEGLAYLHSHYVTHGDLHWKNILLDDNDVPKISDLGMSRVVHTGGNSTSTGPYSSGLKLFMPYEVRQAMEEKDKNREPTLRPDFSTDLYSCGIVLLSIGLPEPQQSICHVEPELERITASFVNPCFTSAAFQIAPPGFQKLILGGEYWKLIQWMTSWNNGDRPQMSKVCEVIEYIRGLYSG